MQVLYRLRSAAERLGIRRESSSTLLEQVRTELADASSDAGDPGVETAELERAALEAGEAARVAAVEREARAERARQVLARLLTAENTLRDAAQARLDELLVERGGIEEELTGAAGEREAALSVSYELRSRAARLAVQRESATRLIVRLRAELAEAEADAARGGPSPEELERQALYARAAAREAAHERDTLAERALTAQERLATLERSLAEREGIPPAARALAEQGETLALSMLSVEPGQERAVAAALGAARLGARRPRSEGCVRTARASRMRPGSARCACSPAATSARSSPSCRSSRRTRCSTRRFRPSRATASATTRSAASCGSPARRPRRCCSSSTRAAVRSPRRRSCSRIRRRWQSGPPRSPRSGRSRRRLRSPKPRRGCGSAAPTSAR